MSEEMNEIWVSKGSTPLNLLPIIHHFLAEDGAEYHLEVLDKAVVIQIIEVDAHFVGTLGAFCPWPEGLPRVYLWP